MKLPIIRLLLCFTVLFYGSFSTDAQQFKWVSGGGTNEDFSSGGSSEFERTEYMCTDANGNVYALSNVGNNPVHADTFYKSGAYGAGQNILLTSYNCQGQMRWAKLIGSSGGASIPMGIVADSLGHIYMAGFMWPSILHIGYDTTITTISRDRIGVIQFDTTGRFNWIQYAGNNTTATSFATNSYVGALAMDGSNNVHFLPYIRSGAVLMPGDTSHYGVYDMVYNTAGILLSATRLGFDSLWTVQNAVIDPVTNKLYVCGEINQSIFGGFLTDTFYAAAFDASRNLIWQYFSGHGDDDGLTGIALDQSKHLYFSGSAQGAPKFVFNNDSVIAPGFDDLSIIMKTDTNGTVEWFKHYDGTGTNAFLGITLMPGNLLAAIGYFTWNIIRDGVTINAGTGSDPFFTVTDTGGNMLSLKRIHGDGTRDIAYAVTSDKAGNLYIGGEVADSIPDTIIPAYHTVGGNSDFFVMKYGVDCSCTGGPIAAYTDTGTHTIGVTYTGTIVGLDSVVWNFGDGSARIIGLTASYTYILADTYRVCATVYTTCGSDIFCKDIVILCGLPPVASFTHTGTHVINTTYTGTTSTVDSVVWNFGDGGHVTGATAAHTYTAIGTYTVCVIAYSHCGNDTACAYDTVLCLATPVSSFTDTGRHTIGVTYTGTTAGTDSIVCYFGDGSHIAGTTAVHTYAAIGTYLMCVVAYSHCGNDTACIYDTVVCVTAPVASFTDTGHITIGATYTGTTVALDSIIWHFGDGSTGSGAIVTHTYTAIGIYTVCVTAYSPCGSSTACRYDTVLCIAAPIASFTDTGSHTIGFAYTGSTAGLDSVVWSFGDGGAATGTPALHTYAAPGVYHVCVYVYTICGIDSFCSDVTVTIPSEYSSIPPTRNNIEVYPNPSKDELYITGITGSINYRVLTVTGKCLSTGVLMQQSNTISMKGFASGIYILELNGEHGDRNIIKVVKE